MHLCLQACVKHLLGSSIERTRPRSAAPVQVRHLHRASCAAPHMWHMMFVRHLRHAHMPHVCACERHHGDDLRLCRMPNHNCLQTFPRANRAHLLPPTVPLETLLFPADRRSETVDGRFCVALYVPDCAQVRPAGRRELLEGTQISVRACRTHRRKPEIDPA